MLDVLSGEREKWEGVVGAGSGERGAEPDVKVQDPIGKTSDRRHVTLL